MFFSVRGWTVERPWAKILAMASPSSAREAKAMRLSVTAGVVLGRRMVVVVGYQFRKLGLR